MKKRFKGKRRLKKQLIFWIIMFFITVLINLYSLDMISFSSLILREKGIVNFIFYNEKILLKLGLNYSQKDKIEEMVFSEIEEEVEDVIKPKIYLYNTHQSEEYADTGVFDMSALFKEKLELNGFFVTHEKTDITSIIKKNNLLYKDSYKITRDLLTKMLLENYDLYIDFHRDSTKKSGSTTSFNSKSYARVMYVIGGNHEEYKKNYNLVDELNKLTKSINKSISRGIFVRKSSSYNQDLDQKVFLLEVGGPENTREEVSNTLDILVQVLKYYFFE